MLYCLIPTALQEISNDILTEQSPKRLYAVRGKLYELLANAIPPEIILRTLLTELLKKLDDELKVEATGLAAFYEHRLQVRLRKLASFFEAYYVHLCHEAWVAIAC